MIYRVVRNAAIINGSKPLSLSTWREPACPSYVTGCRPFAQPPYSPAPSIPVRPRRDRRDCLRFSCPRFISDHDAVMSGVATRSDNPNALPGTTAVFRVVDSGEGADNPPDQVSQLANQPAGSTANCQTLTPMILSPLVGGNIDVRR